MLAYELIGNDPAIQKIRELITVVSDTSFNVLLLGETGTGKGLVARLLHQTASNRRGGRFIKVNCAALPGTLLESELFGYEKGAFTGADRQKPGKFELASKGVIFLDEIGDMPLLLQVKLLHVLQSGQFSRLGGIEDVTMGAWVISSTHHDLEKDMKQGAFREDLYYRLNIIKIELPPLRERKGDIPLLADHFIKEHRKVLRMEQNFSIRRDLMDMFLHYPWPGNARELSSSVLRLMMGDDPAALKLDLIRNMSSDGRSFPAESPFNLKKGELRNEEQSQTDGIIRPLKDVRTDASRIIEKKAILSALGKVGWNKRRAAEVLKISYKTLFNKMKELGIEKNA